MGKGRRSRSLPASTRRPRRSRTRRAPCCRPSQSLLESTSRRWRRTRLSSWSWQRSRSGIRSTEAVHPERSACPLRLTLRREPQRGLHQKVDDIDWVGAEGLGCWLLPRVTGQGLYRTPPLGSVQGRKPRRVTTVPCPQFRKKRKTRSGTSSLTALGRLDPAAANRKGRRRCWSETQIENLHSGPWQKNKKTVDGTARDRNVGIRSG